MPLRRRALVVASVAIASAGCGQGTSRRPRLPQYAYRSPTIGASYEFALGEGAELLRHLLCYCACAGLGHTNLRDCFISDAEVFDSHAAGCEVCVDEAQDAQRLMKQGASVREIRAFIDASYGAIGLGTQTPAIQ